MFSLRFFTTWIFFLSYLIKCSNMNGFVRLYTSWRVCKKKIAKTRWRIDLVLKWRHHMGEGLDQTIMGKTVKSILTNHQSQKTQVFRNLLFINCVLRKKWKPNKGRSFHNLSFLTFFNFTYSRLNLMLLFSMFHVSKNESEIFSGVRSKKSWKIDEIVYYESSLVTKSK